MVGPGAPENAPVPIIPVPPDKPTLPTAAPTFQLLTPSPGAEVDKTAAAPKGDANNPADPYGLPKVTIENITDGLKNVAKGGK